MSNFFNPLLLIPSTLKAALPNSNPAVSEFVDKMAYVKGDTHVLTQHCLRTVREAVFGGVFFSVSHSFWLSQLELVLRSGVAKSGSSVVV